MHYQGNERQYWRLSCLLAGAEEKAKGLKLESERKLKEALAELKHVTELLKAISAKLDYGRALN